MAEKIKLSNQMKSKSFQCGLFLKGKKRIKKRIEKNMYTLWDQQFRPWK